MKTVSLIRCRITSNTILKRTAPYISFRYLNQELPQENPKPFNPFKKKKMRCTRETYIARRMCLTIIGNAAVGQPRCVALFTDIKGFIFNCGEGVGRLCREYEMDFLHMKHFFITQRNWKNLSGLPDVYLTNESYGLAKMTLYGPPGIELFMSVVSSTKTETKLYQKSHYADENLDIRNIPVKRSKLAVHSSHSKTSEQNDDADVVYNYVCKIHKKLGDFNAEKCVDLGVPFGPHLLKLKNGEDVILPSGKVIYSADVLDATHPRLIFLVVDCPSEEFLDSFVHESQFTEYQLPVDSAFDVTAVFHYSPPEIIKSKKYQEWMQKFHQNTEHYILNSANTSTSSSAICQSQSILHLLHPEIFKLLPVKEKSDPEDLSHLSSKIVYPPPMLQLHFRPEKKLNQGNVVNCNFDQYIHMIKEVPDFSCKLKKLESLVSSLSKEEKKYPEILFLGTSSSTSSAFRNVSAIHVQLDSDRSILLDCGEGTVMQLTRYFGESEVDSVLKKISCVFISHLHTDHYLGLFTFVKARMEAFINSGAHYQKLDLILPSKINNIFQRFCRIFDYLRPAVRITSCNVLTFQNRDPWKFKSIIQGIQLETVPVLHCADAYGIVIEDSKWKIVYSGDTAPCQKLIDAGENCTLLIHEASIEDKLLNEASMKKHSTPSQVAEIAERMNAEYTILTHFSKRYLAVPVLPECNKKPIGCAFDFMKVRLNELHLLPHFLPALKCLFQEQIDSHLEKSSSVVSFENVFLRTYQAFKTNYDTQVKNS